LTLRAIVTFPSEEGDLNMPSRLGIIILASLVAGTWAHGFLTLPVARQKGASNLSTAGTVCGFCSCCWYTNGVKIPGKPSICDKELITSGVTDPCEKSDWTSSHPWRAPGTAPISSPCGENGGKDARTLLPSKRLVWKRGSTVEVAMAITANHGGGYIYRLCPTSKAATEQCFGLNSLQFADSKTIVQFTNGTRILIPATRTTHGTFPKGSEWSKNPIPSEAHPNFPPPFPGAVGSKWGFSLVDKVVLPANLSLGDYLLSWRWDCEMTAQVWANCGDVTITNSSGPSPTPATPAPSPTPTPPGPSPTPPMPSPAPTPPAPAPISRSPTCCWSKWGTSKTCGDYRGPNGGKCNINRTKVCASDSDC